MGCCFFCPPRRIDRNSRPAYLRPIGLSRLTASVGSTSGMKQAPYGRPVGFAAHGRGPFGDAALLAQGRLVVYSVRACRARRQANRAGIAGRCLHAIKSTVPRAQWIGCLSVGPRCVSARRALETCHGVWAPGHVSRTASLEKSALGHGGRARTTFPSRCRKLVDSFCIDFWPPVQRTSRSPPRHPARTLNHCLIKLSGAGDKGRR